MHHMGHKMEEILFEYDGYAVARHLTGGSAGNLKLIDPDGRTDWPIFYEPRRIGLDHPEWWPRWLVEAAKILDLFDREMEHELHYERMQLCLVVAHVRATPDPREHYDEDWWGGPFPHYISSWDPEEWNGGIEPPPIHALWADYLIEVATQARRLDSDELWVHLRCADELAIGDLLAASRVGIHDYWRGT